MPRKGHKFTPEQIENMRKGHLGQRAWNTGMGGCKRGHDPAEYKQTPSGVYVCLACKRENAAKYRQANQRTINLKNRVGRYNISIDDFVRLYELQGGCCGICGGKIDRKHCRIDHDHATGAVRGLLCASCNTGIGLFKDSVEVLDKAAEYLRRHGERTDCEFTAATSETRRVHH